MNNPKVFVLKHAYSDGSGHSLMRAYLDQDRANADWKLLKDLPSLSSDVDLVAVELYGVIEQPKVNTSALKLIDTAPRDGRFILLAGPSGYTGTPLRYEAGRWSTDYRAWVNHSNDRFTDGGADATYWMPLPEV